MPQGFGFDGDTVGYAALKKKVLADEARQMAEKEEAARARRQSLGLSEDEHKSRHQKKKEREEIEGKKSFGEKIANFIFNGGRPETLETWQEQRGPSKEFR